MKKIIVLLLTLLMLLSLAACGAQPTGEDTADEPQNEQEVIVDNEDAVDEVSEPIAEMETSSEAETVVSDESTEENSESEEGAPAEEVEDVSSDTTPDEEKTFYDSDNTGANSDGSIGTKIFNGVTIRVFPAGTDVNSITPDPSELIDEVYIGDDVYARDVFNSEWFKRDTSVPPNQDSIIEGELGQEMSPFN